MKRRFPILGYVFIGLMIIGIVVNVRSLLIPIVVLGVIFLLYKFPPAVWRTWFARFGAGQAKSNKKKSSTRFRVIQGKKKDNEPPTYQ